MPLPNSVLPLLFTSSLVFRVFVLLLSFVFVVDFFAFAWLLLLGFFLSFLELLIFVQMCCFTVEQVIRVGHTRTVWS